MLDHLLLEHTVKIADSRVLAIEPLQQLFDSAG